MKTALVNTCACETGLATGGFTVVYIEEDHANALLMHDLLKLKTDWTLHHAIDGNSGLELCQRLSPHLVLTEVNLPGMAAYDFLTALRANAATRDLPCIVLSGDAMPSNIKTALDAGFDDYWTKPFDIWQLLRQIERVLNSVGKGYQQRSKGFKHSHP